MDQARIRTYNDSERDRKRARFYIGKSEMEGLTAANVKMYTNPIIIAIWVGLSSTLVQYMAWWPNPEHGWIGYVSPVPIFVAMMLPIMFGCDWFNRDDFVNSMNDTLRKRDLIDIQSHYSRSPASGVWMLEYGNKFVGLLAVDASQDATSDDVVATPDSKAKLSLSKGTSDVATIRHFFVEEPYRVAEVQTDLLQHALKHVFQANTKVKTVKAVGSDLVPYVGKVLRQEGFKVGETVGRSGLLRWPKKEMVLERHTWEKHSNKSR